MDLDKGSYKYKHTDLFRKYVLGNPDSIEMNMQWVIQLVDQLSSHKNHYEQALKQYNDNTVEVTIRDDKGNLVPRYELYFVAGLHKNALQRKLSSIRKILMEDLLLKVDDIIFTYKQYDDFIDHAIKMVESLGYTLFNTEVKVN